MQVIVNFILRDHHYPVPGTETAYLPPVNPGRLLDCRWVCSVWHGQPSQETWERVKISKFTFWISQVRDTSDAVKYYSKPREKLYYSHLFCEDWPRQTRVCYGVEHNIHESLASVLNSNLIHVQSRTMCWDMAAFYDKNQHLHVVWFTVEPLYSGHPRDSLKGPE